MTKTWIVVADQRKARLFLKGGRELALTDELSHEGNSIDTTRQRGTFDRHAQARFAQDRGRSQGQKSALQFAQEVAALLKEKHLSDASAKFVLVAEPRFLGMLRAQLDDGVEPCVVASITKDLSEVESASIQGHLGDLM